MSRTAIMVATISFACLVCTGAFAGAAKAPKKLTCCEEALAKGKECPHKCCVVAHNKGESCVKCNPGKEDLVAQKKAKAAKKETAAR